MAEKLVKRYGVTAYPTLILFERGERFLYAGREDEAGIVEYMQTEATRVRNTEEMPGAVLDLTLANFTDTVFRNELMLVQFYDPRCKSCAAKLTHFKLAALELKEKNEPVVLAKVNAAAEKVLAKMYGVKRYPTPIIFRKGRPFEYKGPWDVQVLVLNAERYYTEFEPKWHGFNMKEDTKPEEIEDFIKKHEFPLVGSFDSDKDRYSKRSPLCLMFYTVDWSVHHREATQLWRRKLAAIAKDYLDITFAIADEDLNSQLFRDFGLVESGEDINLGIVADGKKYPIKPMEEYDEDHIREFLDQFKRGELQPRHNGGHKHGLDLEDQGHGGGGVIVNKENLTPDQRLRLDRGYEKFHANEYVSNLIPLRRKLKDVAEPECQTKTYNISSLPTAGVVVVFHNEAWSILLRTVHSILGASPPQLLTEVVLVDDASTMDHLGQQLDDYVALLDKVKLVRLTQRSGLMQARMAGFYHVTGHVAAFMDSHCEVPEGNGWLEPLLDRIREDENVLAVPATDLISGDTFQYTPVHGDQQARGGFDLDLYFMWIPQSPEENARRGSLTAPMRSPTHLGCCFAVAKSTFERVGLYDPGLKIWGCENIELSFKEIILLKNMV
nr:hypothetical protein BaRGS_018556 [Batillaria attramentaria]